MCRLLVCPSLDTEIVDTGILYYPRRINHWIVFSIKNRSVYAYI